MVQGQRTESVPCQIRGLKELYGESEKVTQIHQVLAGGEIDSSIGFICCYMTFATSWP